MQITVDQLRGDLPARYYDRLGEGGLRFLLDTGTVYANAHHRHANTETIVGHTTLATGADPAAHGMVGNVWLDLESEDNILRLDRTLADLFGFVDARVGLDRTLIVLSADHGGPEAPGYLSELGAKRPGWRLCPNQ